VCVAITHGQLRWHGQYVHTEMHAITRSDGNCVYLVRAHGHADLLCN